MALTHNTLVGLFGASAVKSDDNSTLTIKLSELGDAGISDVSSLSAEGIVLGLLQKWNATQGADAVRVLELIKSTPLISARGGDSVRSEKYITTVYCSSPVTAIDPSTV